MLVFICICTHCQITLYNIIYYHIFVLLQGIPLVALGLPVDGPEAGGLTDPDGKTYTLLYRFLLLYNTIPHYIGLYIMLL